MTTGPASGSPDVAHTVPESAVQLPSASNVKRSKYAVSLARALPRPLAS